MNLRSFNDYLTIAPDVHGLLHVWRIIQQLGTVESASDSTVRRWRQTTFATASVLVLAQPADAWYVYNTIFTYLDSKQQKQLHDLCSNVTAKLP